MGVNVCKRGSLFTFGVILPIYALAFETMTGLCRSVFFDPMPTLLHAVLIATVPLSQLLVARDLKQAGESPRKLPQILLGAGLCVATVYTLLMIGVMPFVMVYFAMSIFVFFAAAWVLVLPFAPAISLLTGFIYSARCGEAWPDARRSLRRLRLSGMSLALLALVGAEAPRSVTRWGLVTLERDSARADVVGVLRRFGDEDLLLRAAYGEFSDRSDFLGWLLINKRSNFQIFEPGNAVTLDTERAREVFYLVTGRPFNALPRPVPRPLNGMGWFLGSSDTDRGGERVGGIAEGVTLVSSTIDGTIDADGLTSYTEWTMLFENSSQEQAEARAEIRLPVGGVVSRATLWIDGEEGHEREAAIGGRAEVRAAYQKVVSFRRDPLLVTTSGRDRVLVQCFPIPPLGGKMKIRIGVTAPLAARSQEEGVLMVPYLVDRNFALNPEGGDSVWYESKQQLVSQSVELASEQLSPEHFAIRGSMAAGRSEGAAIRAVRNPERMSAWSRDLRGGSKRVVQRLVSETREPARHLVLLVDGSGGLSEERERLAAAIKALPSGTSVAAIIAGDRVVKLAERPKSLNTEALRELAHEVRDYDFEGGADNARGLVAAWDMASAAPGSVIVWLHASQPVRFSSIEELAQRVRRRPAGVRVVSVELVPGSDRITSEPGLEALFESMPAEQFSGGDLGLMFKSLLAPQQRLVSVREIGQDDLPYPTAEETSDNLARLWAAGEIKRLTAIGKDAAARAEALLLAQDYRLVTAISGAVVLETDQQYEESGLEPPSPQANHPSVLPVAPEPELYVMLLLLIPLTVLFARGRLGGVR